MLLLVVGGSGACNDQGGSAGLAAVEICTALGATGLVVEPATAANLAITELNFNPHDPTDAELAVDAVWDNDDFEFIELSNVGTDPLELAGVEAFGIAVLGQD